MPFQNTKVCTRCLQEKSVTDFNKSQGRCRPCQHESFREWREKNSEYQSERWKDWHETHRERRSEYDRGRYKRDPHVSARRLVQMRVKRGVYPPASELPCSDCGGVATDYDHYAGYEGKAREMVQAVCKPCHQVRERRRKGAIATSGQ